MLRTLVKNTILNKSPQILTRSLSSQIQAESLTTNESDTQVSFAELFRKSKFVQLGDLKNRVLVGKITNVVADDIYIDYGGKFECVCKIPEKNPEKYVRNELVKIRLKDFEMASHFLGAVRHITLLESEADLIGLYRPFIEKEPKENSETPKDDAKK